MRMAPPGVCPEHYRQLCRRLRGRGCDPVFMLPLASQAASEPPGLADVDSEQVTPRPGALVCLLINWDDDLSQLLGGIHEVT